MIFSNQSSFKAVQIGKVQYQNWQLEEIKDVSLFFLPVQYLAAEK